MIMIQPKSTTNAAAVRLCTAWAASAGKGTSGNAIFTAKRQNAYRTTALVRRKTDCESGDLPTWYLANTFIIRYCSANPAASSAKKSVTAINQPGSQGI